MLKRKIENQVSNIGTLAGKVDSSTWMVLRYIQAELKDAAAMAEMYENCLTVPKENGAAPHSSVS
jgi:hypothetical protein